MTRMKMKDLERESGVGRETIRFYIREGLLPEPDRPSRNVAWYDRSFVDRIAAIKELQRTRRLPLHVIKAIIANGDESRVADQNKAIAQIGKLMPGASPPVAEKLADVAKRTKLPVSVLRQLGQVGAIQVRTYRRAEWLDDTSVRIVELWTQLHHAGFTEELGYGPEQLELYVEFVSTLAREEIRRFAKHIPARVSLERSVKMSEAGIHYMNQILALMRRSTLLRIMNE